MASQLVETYARIANLAQLIEHYREEKNFDPYHILGEDFFIEYPELRAIDIDGRSADLEEQWLNLSPAEALFLPRSGYIAVHILEAATVAPTETTV